MTKPLISVIVLNWHGEAMTTQCVESVRASQFDGPVELIIVDNESSKQSRDSLGALGAEFLVPLRRNVGFASGMNAGAARASGEYLVFLNNDLIVGGSWLTDGIDTLAANAGVAMVGGPSFTWNGSEGHPDEECERPYSIVIVDPRDGSSMLTRTVVPRPVSVSSLDGGAFIVRSSVWRLVGGFDDDFFAYYDDVDLCARIIRSGLSLAYVPSMTTWHRRGASSDRMPLRRSFWSQRNHLFLIAKHFPPSVWSQTVRRAIIDLAWRAISGRTVGIRGWGDGRHLSPVERWGAILACVWGALNFRLLSHKHDVMFLPGTTGEDWRSMLVKINSSLPGVTFTTGV